MVYEFDNDKPIYKQLVDHMKVSIVTGIYKPGDKLASVRDLATEIKINPNTIQRALQELEDEKLIITKRTLGKFITEDSKTIEKYKKELANSTMDRFISEISKLNISNKEIIDYISLNRREN